jgi:hypothetical protein
MKIVQLDTLLTNAGLRNYLFVRLTTDAGLTGLGEASLEWQERAVEVLLHDWVRDRVIGRDPFDVEALATLINTARGAIIDEAALIEALGQERIAGAALDVFDGIDVFSLPGAPPRHPLLELDNVILTPHSAGSSVESTRASKVRGVRNAAEVLLGRWPAHVVNPEVRPRFPLQR